MFPPGAPPLVRRSPGWLVAGAVFLTSIYENRLKFLFGNKSWGIYSAPAGFVLELGQIAKVAELADALDLGSSGETRGGSSPPFRTNGLRLDVFGPFPLAALSRVLAPAAVGCGVTVRRFRNAYRVQGHARPCRRFVVAALRKSARNYRRFRGTGIQKRSVLTEDACKHQSRCRALLFQEGSRPPRFSPEKLSLRSFDILPRCNRQVWTNGRISLWRRI